MEERLQKILAQAGFGSRRSCEELITAQRVKVNGRVAELGSKADSENDTITVDGQGIPKMPAQIYIALNKPREILSDIDPNDPRRSIHDLVNVPGHLFAVGRLDYESEGLILMTNDGELANRLTHPRYGHEKEYRVWVGSRPDEEQLAIWRRGVVLADGYRTQPAEVVVDNLAGKGVWLRVVLREGRKRQIREVGARIGLPILRILRVRIGTLLLGELKVGEWRYLTADEIRKLKADSGKPSRRPYTVRPRSNTWNSDRKTSSDQPKSSEDRTNWRSKPRTGASEDRSDRRPAWKPRSESGQNENHPGANPAADRRGTDQNAGGRSKSSQDPSGPKPYRRRAPKTSRG
jgi:23S rRNA pseudouridine2605 synthase